ncbi:MAG TPA: cytochrome C oxidase subunit IV family protein [Acidimicrobiales bacterium]|nr:cytochrome C oxidase subunit IV family protein [Acidimicrobiales bacterium]
MATDTATEGENHPVETAGHEGAAHPSEGTYWKIFWALFLITGVEVALYYVELPGNVNINNSALGLLAVAKFMVVVGYFMHLRFDSLLLRRLFVGGLLLAVVVYVAVLLSMGVFLESPGDRNTGFVN